MTVWIFLVGMAVIVFSAWLFTNGIEVLGRLVKLSEGTVGSLFAAWGTALPETMVPIVAILFGHSQTTDEEIGVGAILGAPLLLATLAFGLIGVVLLIRRVGGRRLRISQNDVRRDLGFFAGGTTLVLAAGLVPHFWFHEWVAIFLFLAYVFFIVRVIRDDKGIKQEFGESPTLWLWPRPNLFVTSIQLLMGLGGMIAGARLFLIALESINVRYGIPPFIASVILAPLATELPELFNSLLWVYRGKDRLALANVTGALVFQSAVVPAVGLLATSWHLSWIELFVGLMSLTGALLVWLFTKEKRIGAFPLLFAGLMYVITLYYLVQVLS